MNEYEQKTRRPLGLTLMIAVCAMFYVVLPLLVTFYPVVMAHTLDEVFGDAGADLPWGSAAQVVFSVVFAVVLVLAWRGSPSWVRFAIAALALIQAGVVIINGLIILGDRTPLESGWVSIEEVRRDIQAPTMLGAVALALFVTWYFNRAPAVAFFTGRPIRYIDRDE
jgi:hypothetical protein